MIDSLFSDPIVFRGIERILFSLGAIVFAILGYKLYIKGVQGSQGEAKFKSPVSRDSFIRHRAWIILYVFWCSSFSGWSLYWKS